MMIKAIVLFQPWASLVATGAKTLEFRSWSYVERGVGVKPNDRIGISAAKRPIKPAEVEDLLHRLGDSTCSTGLTPSLARPLLQNLLRAHKCQGVLEMGSLICTARIGAPVLTVDAMPLWKGLVADSDRLEHCKWAWPMHDVVPLERPMPVRGTQGFFNVSVPR